MVELNGIYEYIMFRGGVFYEDVLWDQLRNNGHFFQADYFRAEMNKFHQVFFSIVGLFIAELGLECKFIFLI